MQDLEPKYYEFGTFKMNCFFEVDWYDYGWRKYDAAIGRWHCTDKLAERYASHSPYAYVMNNPMNYIDPNGLEAYLSPMQERMIGRNGEFFGGYGGGGAGGSSAGNPLAGGPSGTDWDNYNQAIEDGYTGTFTDFWKTKEKDSDGNITYSQDVPVYGRSYAGGKGPLKFKGYYIKGYKTQTFFFEIVGQNGEGDPLKKVPIKQEVTTITTEWTVPLGPGKFKTWYHTKENTKDLIYKYVPENYVILDVNTVPGTYEFRYDYPTSFEHSILILEWGSPTFQYNFVEFMNGFNHWLNGSWDNKNY